MRNQGDVDPVSYMRAVLSLLRDNALHWPSVDEAAFTERHVARAARVRTQAALHEVVNAALRELGDRHSRLIPRRDGGKRKQALPSGSYGAALGYLEVPAFSSGSREVPAEVYADRLRTLIADHREKGARGWIVDLRENGGGNMWPMLAGLAPLLGEGPVGSFVHPSKGVVGVWRASSRTAGPGDMASPSGAEDQTGRPVAVLTSDRTASSGEAVAIAFRGRALSRSFGTPTRGLSTANISTTMPDGAILAVTSSIMADRLGRAYGARIVPDVAVDPTAAHGGDDPVLGAARAWLSSLAGVG